jgi:putative flippase GtrA
MNPIDNSEASNKGPSKPAKIFAKLIGFGSIGVLTTALGIGAYYILLERLHLSLYPVYVSVWCGCVFFSYVMNTRFNYKRPFNLVELIKYYGGYAVGLLFSLLLIAVLKYWVSELSDFVLTLIPIIPRFLLVFIFVNRFAFRN